MLNTTLCYIRRGGDYLMLHRIKKAHDLNRDKWIGIGGKFEDKEPGGLSAAGGPRGNRTHAHGLPLPRAGYLCLRPLANRIHAPVHRRRLDRGAEGM